MHWAIQTNVICEDDREAILQALRALGYSHEGFTAIPFSKVLPNVLEPNTVFYGSTNVINEIHLSNKWDPGTFFTEKFDYRVWSDRYKILNANHELLELREIGEKHFYGPDKLAFIRPVLDLKEFAGDVISWNRFETWKSQLLNLELLLDCVCVVAEPFGIAKEWRTFVVDGKLVAASQYREYMKLSTTSGCPNEVTAFVEEQSTFFSPHPIFVMDVGLSGDDLYVIEVGCFNSAGFYDSKLIPLFEAIQNYHA